MSTVRLYRSVIRQAARSSISPRTGRNKEIAASFRRLFEGPSRLLEHDAENMVTFMRSQREHKTLLDRYNPLADLTVEERVEATARRVGLNMPKKVV